MAAHTPTFLTPPRKSPRTWKRKSARYYAKRDAEIYRLVVIEGQTLKMVGAQHGITLERVRQIITRTYRRKSGVAKGIKQIRKEEGGPTKAEEN